MSTMPKCKLCNDTGLYVACCRPHLCDCAAGQSYEESRSRMERGRELRNYALKGSEPHLEALLEEATLAGRRAGKTNLSFALALYEMHEQASPELKVKIKEIAKDWEEGLASWAEGFPTGCVAVRTAAISDECISYREV